MIEIIPPRKIVARESLVHGLGVFCIEKILQGEVIEECPVFTLPIAKGESSPLLIDYRFNWPQGNEWDEQVVSWGYGSLYNHSDPSNAYWISDIERRTFKFIASRDIHPEEEIFVWYGDMNYWNDGRNHTSVV
jgi:SET domain-containing protein